MSKIFQDEEAVPNLQHDVVGLAKQVGLDIVKEEDMMELLEHQGELIN